MKRTSQEIAKDPSRMRDAAREGFSPQVRNFIRQAERERRCEKGNETEKDEGFGSSNCGRVATTAQSGS
jgi:hypothetical protein